MIDTHCHLDAVPEPDSSAAQLEFLIAIGFNPERARSCLALAERLPNVYATVGLHPTDANMISSQTIALLEQLALHPKVVGIGESGIDYYWDTATPQNQFKSLEWQLDLARRLDKPIVIHCRDKDNSSLAFADCAAILQNAGWTKGILHCFAGDSQLLETGLGMAKIGAVREGVLRQYQIRPDGYVRNSVMFSVLKTEWQVVKTKLEARVGI